MNTVLETSGLTKHYGSVKALKDFNLSIEKGAVYGILGPNGSGKTTALGMMLGVINPTSGSYNWFNGENEKIARQKIGALLETPNFYPYLTGENNLKVVAEIKNCDYSKIEEVLKLVDLYERRVYKFKGYSLGMKQRLAIAAALLNDPEVLILDEPTNGLDPQGIADMRELIREISSRGITILLASHILDEVEKVCSHVAVIRKGDLLASGRVEEVFAEAKVVEVKANDSARLKEAISENKFGRLLSEDDGLFTIEVSEKLEPFELNKALADKGIYLSHLIIKKKSLEQGFLEMIAKK